MSSVLIPPEIRTCGTCGSAECECEAVLAELDARAGSLAHDGFRAAAEGRLHHAATRLGEALRLNAGDATACAVLGLCRLALGDAPGARAAWRLAETDDCAAWLRSLQDGELRDAFRAHDEALASARDGHHGAALAALDRALAIVPDLVPAARLRGLVLLAQGNAGAAREAWSAALAVCRDDPALLRFLAETPAPPAAPAPVPAAETARPARTGRIAPFAAGAVTAAVAAGIAAMLAWPSATPAVYPAPFRDASAPAGAPPVAASASAGSAGPAGSASTEPAGVLPAGASGASAESTASASSASPDSSAVHASGWEAYRVGREAHAKADWAAAATALTASVAAGENRFYHDDALYLLARSLARAGRTDEARAAARRLAREHPASPFHNRVARAIASTGAEPAR